MNRLFSIPIYTCDKSEFKDAYKKYIYKKAQPLLDASHDTGMLSDEECIKKAEREFPFRNVWFHNQIIGYLEIYENEKSIWFDLYYDSSCKKIHKFREKKYWMSLHQLTGVHFSLIGDNLSIAEKILSYIKMIEQDYIWFSKFYLDLSYFYSIYKHIDYLSLL